MSLEVRGDAGGTAMRAFCCVAALALGLASATGTAMAHQRSVLDGHPIRLAQATDQTTTTTTVTPVTPNSSSATCLFGCSSQQQNCQNNCFATINNTTIIPSVTTAGVTTNPNQCQSNCSAQSQQCQRGCALVQ
jgi:hypothetical protein